jgi:hypothetical protein
MVELLHNMLRIDLGISINLSCSSDKNRFHGRRSTGLYGLDSLILNVQSVSEDSLEQKLDIVLFIQRKQSSTMGQMMECKFSFLILVSHVAMPNQKGSTLLSIKRDARLKITYSKCP